MLIDTEAALLVFGILAALEILYYIRRLKIILRKRKRKL
jgi:hypothetical protein